VSPRSHAFRLLALRCAAGFALALVVAGAAIAVATGPGGTDALIPGLRHALVCAIAAAAVIARAVLVRRDRAVWVVFGLAAGFYAAALGAWTLAFDAGDSTPATLVFLGADLLFWAALGLYLRRRLGDALKTFWLDAIGGALCLLTVITAFLLAETETFSHLGRWAAASNLFYPAADAALASVPLIVASCSGRRMRGQDVLLALAFVIAMIADGAYAASLAGRVPAWGAWFDLGWELQLILLGCAAWARPSSAGALRIGGWWESAPTGLLLITGGSTLVAGQFTHLDTLTIGLAVAALSAGALRSVLVLRDVRRLVVERREALTDDLTGLPNRRALLRALDLLTRDGGGSGERAELLVIDLDGFRELNETLGHEAGDALLRAAAERLKPVIGEDLLVRHGADEFAAIVRPPADADLVADAVRAALAVPIELDDVTVAIEGTVGIAAFPGDARRPVELARRADVAMSDAKRRRVGVARYAVERDEHSRDRLELAADLRHALAARDCGGLWAAFQPQVEPATGRVTGAETLIRWTHPTRGEISPAELLPVAERSGQMAALTDWILERALSECAGLRSLGHKLRIAVNVSAVTLVDLGLPDRIAAALKRQGVDAQDLVIEVTEDAIMSDQRRCLDVLDRIAALGVEISVDDFGTGQSSLAQLRHLPADELKIDRSFVKGMAEDPLDAEVVRLVIGMGRSMGLRVVAEGIETLQERDVLAGLGCDLVQGFGIGRPMPAAELERFLADWAVSDPQRRYAR
jgi:diguanylate cyclase (GGDEF)-like protein